MTFGSPVDDYATITRDAFQNEIVPAGRPAVFRGVVEAWPASAAARCSPEALTAYLARHDSGRPLSTYLGPPAINGRFFYRDDLRGFNFDRGKAPFGAVAKMLLADIDSGSGPAIYSGSAPADEHFPTFAAENAMPLLDPAIAPRLWIGNAVTVSTHYDASYNIACVVAGTRRFTLFPPEQVGNLYVGPLENTISGQPVSMVDPLAPDRDRFPRFAEAQAVALTADLAPGDAIYIPTMWWHHVRSTSRFNVLVNYWWNAPSDGSAYEALIHAMLAIRDRPADERAAWRAFFEHYVFASKPDGADHLPDHARGILGKSGPERNLLMREFLIRGLQSKC